MHSTLNQSESIVTRASFGSCVADLRYPLVTVGAGSRC